MADADNNTVAVVNVEKPGQSQVEGFIPAGWYPTAAMFSRDGSRIFVLSGKGLCVESQSARQSARDRRRRGASISVACCRAPLSILGNPVADDTLGA